ncbi:MAG: acetate/propionate family kinase [Hyphomicrobiaceae bacterium]
MTDVVLIANSGSSSLKFAVYPVANERNGSLIKGKVAGIGRQPVLTALDDNGAIEATGALKDIPHDANHEWIISELLERLQSRFSNLNPVAAGHRVVHGGQEFTGPVLVDDKVRGTLERFVCLAPLHQPHNLAAIDAIAKLAPGMPQVVCFDTSFHRTQPRLAQLFALPRELTDEGIIRYGFHGLSYEYIASVLPMQLGPVGEGRVIVAHLGNGASMCAMKERKGVASSMGFTALDGLVMGRRCGTLDAGVVLHLLKNKGMTPDEVQRMLYQKSGLLGVSGISNNMRDLEASAEANAREAIELFCYRAVREIGALAATLGGLDALVFTAGIGENSALVRKLICQQSAWLGVDLDEGANATSAPCISSKESAVDVHVIPTDEEAVIAAATRDMISTTHNAGARRLEAQG